MARIPGQNQKPELISSGSIAFSAGDNLTTEKQTADISIGNVSYPADNVYLLAIEKPVENTAGNLTVYVYNQIKIDGTNQRDVLHTTHTVEKITDVATYRDFLIQGLFIGEGKIQIGMKLQTDSGALEIFWKLYRL